MKKLLILLIPLFIMCSCSKSVDATDLTALKSRLPEVGENKNFIKLSVGEALNYFNFKEEDIEEYLIYISRDGAIADEVVIIKAVNNEAASRVFNALRDRFEEKKNSFQNYVPAEYDKICRSRVEQSGLYCYYAISDIQDSYEAVFNMAF